MRRRTSWVIAGCIALGSCATEENREVLKQAERQPPVRSDVIGGGDPSTPFSQLFDLDFEADLGSPQAVDLLRRVTSPLDTLESLAQSRATEIHYKIAAHGTCLIASGFPDGVRLWDIRSWDEDRRIPVGQPTELISGDHGEINSKGDRAVVWSRQETKLVELIDCKVHRSVRVPVVGVGQARFAGERHFLLSTREGVSEWSLEAGSEDWGSNLVSESVRRKTSGGFEFRSAKRLRLNARGDLLAINWQAREATSVELFHRSDQWRRLSMPGEFREVSFAAFGPGGTIVTVDGRTISIWEEDSGGYVTTKKLDHETMEVSSVAVHPDGSEIAVLASKLGGEAQLGTWSTKTGWRLHELPKGFFGPVQFSLDGEHLVVLEEWFLDPQRVFQRARILRWNIEMSTPENDVPSVIRAMRGLNDLVIRGAVE